MSSTNTYRDVNFADQMDEIRKYLASKRGQSTSLNGAIPRYIIPGIATSASVSDVATAVANTSSVSTSGNVSDAANVIGATSFAFSDSTGASGVSGPWSFADFTDSTGDYV